MSTTVELHLRPLEVPVALSLPDEVGDRLRSMLAALGAQPGGGDGTPTAARRIRLCRDGTLWSAHVDDGPGMYGDDPLGLTVMTLTWVAVHHTPLLGVHAGVLAGPDGTVVIPGASGLGKSTLVACAVRAGFGYLSDEVLAVDRRTGAVHPFPRPVALDAIAWRLAGLPEEECPVDGAEHLMAPDKLGPMGSSAPISDIVLLARVEGEPAHVERAGPGGAVSALVRHSFNHFDDAAGSFERVSAIVRSARVWQVTYGDADELAQVLVNTLGVPGHRSGTVPSEHG